MIRKSVLIQYGLDHVIHSSMVLNKFKNSVFNFCCDTILCCFCFVPVICFCNW